MELLTAGPGALATRTTLAISSSSTTYQLYDLGQVIQLLVTEFPNLENGDRNSK